MFEKALQYRNTHVTQVNSFDEFKEVLENTGGFVSAHWDGTAATEEKIKDLTKATIRCIPLDQQRKKVFVFFRAQNPQVEYCLQRHTKKNKKFCISYCANRK
jgi:prolyl-tRNA synthetase